MRTACRHNFYRLCEVCVALGQHLLAHVGHGHFGIF